MNSWGRLVFAGCMLAFVALPAKAVIAFSNLGSPFSWDAAGYAVVGDYNASNSWIVRNGFRFTSSETGLISAVHVALGYNSGQSTPTFDLYSNTGSDTLGSVIATFTGVTPGSGTPGSTQLLSGSGASLVAGSQYWFVAREPDPTARYGWALATSMASLPHVRSTDDGSTFIYDNQRQGALQIEVSPQSVPEPFTMALMGGAALAGYRRMRRKKA